MEENLMLALQITLIGMGIVFGAIILLGVVMAVLVRLTPENKEPDEAGEAQVGETTANEAGRERKQRAAAAAVAIALAQSASNGAPHAFPLPPTSLVSAWQAVMRTRILTKRGPTR